MGRRKRNLTEAQMEAQKLSGKRIREFRKNDMCGMTQAKFAEKLGCSTLTIGRYERGEVIIPHTAIKKLVYISGFIPQYWEGLTECKTEQELNQRLELFPPDDPDEPAHTIIQENRERQRNRVKSLMNFCGFAYDDFSADNRQYRFAECSKDPDTVKGANMATSGYPHRIVKYGYTGASEAVFFNDDEMNHLLSDISDLIAFRCYQKREVTRAEGRSSNEEK